MNIKRRLIISNTVTMLIPFIITILAAGIFILVSSGFFNQDISYNGFKKLAQMETELFNTATSISKQSPEAVQEVQFQQYLTQRLSSFGGKFIITRGQQVIASSKDLNNVDIEQCLEDGKNNSFENQVNIDNNSFVIQTTELTLKDGTKEQVILLAPVGGQWDFYKWIIIGAILIFSISFILVNFTMSYLFTKRILNPIAFLKKAASQISSGNLECEIIEEGDEEIKELCHDFETMRVQLKDSVNMKMKYDDNRKMLISSISHDLKTPITSIKGYVEGILDGVANTPEKMESYLRTIYSKTEHMDAMIDDLLLYSRLDLKQLPFNFEKTDIIDYFSYCIYESKLELSKYSINISLNNELHNSKLVMLDRDRMRRVILNIIDNCRKYMNKDQGQITIYLRETNSSLIIEIRDNGAGIASGDINRIFERFYRGDSSRSGTKGTGLGLAIAKQIVEGHKGRIWAVSHGDEGTSIIISLGKLIENRGIL